MEIASVKSLEGMRHQVRAGVHDMITDEPVELGGTGTGPNPYELLLAALGSCTSMTVLMYARRKGWPIEGVEVDLSHDKVYADDCKECEGRTGRVDRIERHIRLKGPLTDEQVQRLAEIAARCPVHQTLTNSSVVVDDVKRL